MASVNLVSKAGNRRVLPASPGLFEQLGVKMIRSSDGRVSASRGWFTYGQYVRLMRSFKDFPPNRFPYGGILAQLPPRQAASLSLDRIRETLGFLGEKTGRRFYVPQGRKDVFAKLIGSMEHRFRVIELHFNGEISPGLAQLLEQATLDSGQPTEVI